MLNDRNSGFTIGRGRGILGILWVGVAQWLGFWTIVWKVVSLNTGTSKLSLLDS